MQLLLFLNSAHFPEFVKKLKKYGCIVAVPFRMLSVSAKFSPSSACVADSFPVRRPRGGPSGIGAVPIRAWRDSGVRADWSHSLQFGYSM